MSEYPRIKKVNSDIIDPVLSEFDDIKIKKKRGRKVDNYVFNPAPVEITDTVIHSLIEKGHIAEQYLYLEEVIADYFDGKYYHEFINSTDGVLRKDKITEAITSLDLEGINLTEEEVYNYFVLEVLILKEENNATSRKSKNILGLRKDYSNDVLTNVQIAELNSFKGKSYDEDDFYSVFTKNPLLKDKYFLIRNAALDTKSFNDNVFNFPDLDGDLNAIGVSDIPFNYVDTQPRYFYPVLPNGTIIPLTDKKYTYGNKNVSSYQQIELSTASTHNAFYYRKATFYYTLDCLKLIRTMYLFFDESKNVDFHDVFQNTSTEISKMFSDNISVFKIIAYLEKMVSDKDILETMKTYVYNVYKLQRIFTKTKKELVEKAKKIVDKDSIEVLFEEATIIYRDKDLYGNVIPLFYRKDENDKVVFVDDIEEKDGLHPTNYIVAKGKNKNGKIVSVPIDSINEDGIDEVLSNNIDYPVYAGFHDVRTPYSIYYPPKKNNIVKKGLMCTDGNINYNWLKRTRILYIPSFYFDANGTKIKIDQDNYVVPEGRVLSNLPALAYSYLLTPLTESDKLTYLKNLI